MKKLFLFIILFNLIAATGFSQIEDPGVRYANTITPAELKEHLSILASDAFEGRETGQPGLVMAGDYIASQFRLAGVVPVAGLNNYFQNYDLIEFGWGTTTIADKKNLYILMQDFYGYPSANNSLNFTSGDLLWMGYGIDDSLYSDYGNFDVKGKVIMVSGGEPMREGKSLLTGSEKLSAWSTDWRKKVEAATAHGAKCILMIDPNCEAIMNNGQWKSFLNAPLLKLKSEYSESAYCNSFFISEKMAEKMLGKKKKFMAKSIKNINKDLVPDNFLISAPFVFNINKYENNVSAANVIGFVEGTDLKDEVIVVSAHYDHLGKNDTAVFNGADDDGSGTVAVLEIAEAIATAKLNGEGPRRSILFITFSGEEKGLLGSKSYALNPAVPFSNTVADLNIDMIGRIDEDHVNDSNYVYIIGSDFLSTQLHKINEAAAKNYTSLTLDYKFNNTSDPNRFYYRSDHYNFAKNNVPVIFYFNGTHADYHKTTDDIEKINFPLLAERSKLVFHTLWILANQDARIKVDVVQE